METIPTGTKSKDNKNNITMTEKEEQKEEETHLTPMMSQYYSIQKSIKKEHPKSLIFFRLGDFYEMFDEDAQTGSQILGIALTKRQKTPMCGIPYHAKENYLGKLIQAGYTVVICDQLEEASQSKGLVPRGVTEILTPGTLVEEELLNQLPVQGQNFISALFCSSKFPDSTLPNSTSPKIPFALAYLELSTGEFWVYEEDYKEDEKNYEENYAKGYGKTHKNSTKNSQKDFYTALFDHLSQISVREILIAESLKTHSNLIESIERYSPSIAKNFLPDYYFDLTHAQNTLLETLGTTSLRAFGLEAKPLVIRSCGALISYLKKTKKRNLEHIDPIRLFQKKDYLLLNESSIRNLELIEENSMDTRLNKASRTNEGPPKTLYGVLNYTRTQMGKRSLQKWILQPLIDLYLIQNRLDRVQFWVENPEYLNQIRENLSQILDLERLTSRIALNKIQAIDLDRLKHSLHMIQRIQKTLVKVPLYQKDLQFEGNNPEPILELLKRAIVPAKLQLEQGIIQKGFSEKLDSIRLILNQGKQYLLQIQKQERLKLKIPTLRIKYNRVLGYFIEVSKGQSRFIPEYYIKKQTLSNVDRYTLEELSLYESQILSAEEDIQILEREIVEDLRKFLLEYLKTLKTWAKFLIELDILQSFAYLALQKNYSRPEVHGGEELLIEKGRHPVVEGFMKKDFIPNDTILNTQDSRIHIITGPNMAGKSTYLRQTALIVLMAQMGCFVPAERAKIPIVDQIFTRIGAGDRLIRGESTFLVEMIETASILHHATNRSLVIMDEIGRGTSTYDGLALAKSIIEYLVQKKKPKVLFATHFHELHTLAGRHGIQNYQFLVQEWNQEIIFLHRVEKGLSSRSYGIHVAKLAGLPKEVIQRAKKLAEELEQSTPKKLHDSPQLLLFDDQQPAPTTLQKSILKSILQIDLHSPSLIQELKALKQQIQSSSKLFSLDS